MAVEDVLLSQIFETWKVLTEDASKPAEDEEYLTISNVSMHATIQI